MLTMVEPRARAPQSRISGTLRPLIALPLKIERGLRDQKFEAQIRR
jgi:hypothetical protein